MLQQAIAKIESDTLKQWPPDRVLSIDQWAALAGISLATAERLIASGDGPCITKLSKRRVGIRLADHARWLDARTLAGAKTEPRPVDEAERD